MFKIIKYRKWYSYPLFCRRLITCLFWTKSRCSLIDAQASDVAVIAPAATTPNWQKIIHKKQFSGNKYCYHKTIQGQGGFSYMYVVYFARLCDYYLSVIMNTGNPGKVFVAVWSYATEKNKIWEKKRTMFMFYYLLCLSVEFQSIWKNNLEIYFVEHLLLNLNILRKRLVPSSFLR